jgi:CRISPR-associated endonuclease/helicase Cas3
MMNTHEPASTNQTEPTAYDDIGLDEITAIQADRTLCLEAHRGEKLMGHCLAVGTYARRLMREMPLRPPDGLTIGAIEKLAFLAGACHDLGKAAGQFQRYLHSDDWREKESLKADPLTRHALLGAVFAHRLLSRSDLDRDLKATPVGRILRLAPFWVIRRHHGNLLWPGKDLMPKSEDTANLAKQLDDCPPAELDRILDQIVRLGGFTPHALISHGDIRASIADTLLDLGCDGQDIVNDFADLRKSSEMSLAPWLVLQQLFSVLLAADKSYAAVEIRRAVNDLGMGPKWVARYRASNFHESTEGVNAWRDEVARVATETIDSASTDTPFFQLTLPTGLGKTLIALDCALRLRERLREASRPPRTIIYALPFLTILEQAAGVYDHLFAAALGCDVKLLPSDLMIRHHHLAELRYVKAEALESDSGAEAADKREFNPNQSQLMIEGWRSALIMTSTVQLFQSLFSGRNRTTRKLHRLAGAIVVLDEVQSIPYKYWPLMRRTMRALNALFDTRFLLVTATQPRFLDEPSVDQRKAVELVPCYKTYFDRLNRTLTAIDLEPRTVAAFAEIITERLKGNHRGQDALIIVNTIGTAIALFQSLSETFGDTHEVLHLSTNIIPDERARRIALAKDRQRPARPIIVVSTQLVEAGVDFSFPVLFRDFAPFASLVQAAGRANRNGEYPVGRVYVHTLTTDKGKRLADYIYDPVELDVTKRVLDTLPSKLSEKELIAGIETYFKEIQPRGTQASQSVLNGARTLCFKPKSKGETDALEIFRLIEDKETLEVFIEIDERAAEAWREYDTLYRQPFNPTRSLEESFAHAGKLRAAQIKCRPFILSVPAKYFNDEERAQARKDEICYYSHSEIASVYNRTTGWIRTRQD